ncbi:MAG: SDR family NAD(P)-dependent oxidoreductase [Mycobacteriales bacterium]
MTRLAGAAVLVTGGSEGIGLETARLLVARGAKVTVLSRSAVKLAAARATLGDVTTVSADVTDPGALEGLGSFDVLVAAAGGAEPQHFLTAEHEALRRQMDLNYFGAVNAVRAVLPGMLAAGRGHVVLLSSAAALCGVFGYSGYGPAKAALRNLAEVVAAEHPTILVAVAYPPDTRTPGFERENRTKPRETAAVSAMVKPLSAQRVAEAIVRGIEQDRRTITADAGTALLARATTVVAPGVRVAMRRAVRRS